MTNRHFATRTYPTFGTATRPKPEKAWKSSVYYWWWEYLRRNESYLRCCERNGAGQMAALYADMGDIRTVDFKAWWNEDNRGPRLFAEPVAKAVFSELSYEQLSAMDSWNTKAMMVIAVPLDQSKRHLAKKFAALLKRRHSGRRGQSLRTLSLAKYPLAAPFKIDSLQASLAAYDLRLANPKLPLWKVALDTGLAPTVQRELKGQMILPDADQRNSLSVAASRAIKRAKAMVKNAGKGVFPKA